MITPKTAQTAGIVAAHYDELDSFYREIWGDHVHHGYWVSGNESVEQAVEALIELAAMRLNLEAGQQVCDIGCGYGASARYLARLYKVQVTGLTISPVQAKQAQTFAVEPAGSVSIRQGDWLANDFAAESFDRAYAIESSEHMPDKTAFFSEAFRVLRPGGRAVVCAWLAREAASGFENRFLLEPVCREGRMPHMGTELDYRHFFEKAGFNFESFKDLTKQVKRTWPICAVHFFINLCCKPAYAKFLFNQHSKNRIFALTMFRIWLAYNTGSMRYGIFTAYKPD
jgi:tocopherol O-methyltransferase